MFHDHLILGKTENLISTVEIHKAFQYITFSEKLSMNKTVHHFSILGYSTLIWAQNSNFLVHLLIFYWIVFCNRTFGENEDPWLSFQSYFQSYFKYCPKETQV